MLISSLVSEEIEVAEVKRGRPLGPTSRAGFFSSSASWRWRCSTSSLAESSGLTVCISSGIFSLGSNFVRGFFPLVGLAGLGALDAMLRLPASCHGDCLSGAAAVAARRSDRSIIFLFFCNLFSWVFSFSFGGLGFLGGFAENVESVQ